jgi:DHA1 family tetracycline resistance protein-like MFS transporter
MTAPPSTAPATTAPRAARPLLFLTVFLDIAGFGMILPLLPFYAQRYGADAFEVGALFACYSLAQGVCAPLLGRLSDRFGRRPVLLAALLANAGALLLFASAHSFAALFLARTASGVAAANFSIAQAYVADITAPHERARGLGMIGAALGMGFVLGPALGGLLALLGQVAVPLGAAALTLVNFALLAWRLPESLPKEARRGLRGFALVPLAGLARLERPLLGLLALFFTVVFAFSIMEGTLALYCAHRFGFGVGETSALLVTIGVVIAVVQGAMVGRLVTRFGERRLMVAGIVLMALGLLAIPAAPLVGLLTAACALMAVGSGIHQPSLLGLLSQLSGSAEQGEALGLSRSMQAFARTFGPLWGGWTFKTLGVSWPFWTAGGVMALAGVGAAVLLARHHPSLAQPARAA